MNVRLRNLTQADLPTVMAWRMRPDITRFMNTDPRLTPEGQQRWFEKISADPTQRFWIVEYDGVPIGSLSIFDIDRVNSRCSWGYYIAETDYRSLQLATWLEWNLYDHVLLTMGLHKLCNETFVENKYVVQLHKLCGGHEDGVLPAHICKNGRYYDVSVGSILREEWLAKRERYHYETFPFPEEPA